MVSSCEVRKSCVGRVGISILGSVSKGLVVWDFVRVGDGGLVDWEDGIFW